MSVGVSSSAFLSRRCILAGVAATATAPAIGLHAAASSQTQPVILTVGGLVTSPAPHRLTLDDIERLGIVGFETRTPWYAERCRFDGVRLDRLAVAVGGHGTVLRVEALNDYAADIPVSDLADFGPILATRRDGAPMPVSDKGPLFVVYPFDDLPSTRPHAVFARSVWQVRQIDFR